MCDLPYGKDAYEAIARVPALLTFASGIGIFLSPNAFPGGSSAFFVGLVLMAVLARIFKLFFGAVTDHAGWTLRPCIGVPRAPGFPSSHAMVMGFAAGAFAADAALRPMDRLRNRRIVFAILVGVLTLLVAVGRCVQKCHTPLQVGVGTVLGVGFGALYGATVVRASTRRHR